MRRCREEPSEGGWMSFSREGVTEVLWYYKCIVNRGIHLKAFRLACWARGRPANGANNGPAHMSKAIGKTVVRWKALFTFSRMTCPLGTLSSFHGDSTILRAGSNLSTSTHTIHLRTLIDNVRAGRAMSTMNVRDRK